MEQKASGNCLNRKGLSDEKGFDFIRLNTGDGGERVNEKKNFL